MFYRNSLPLAEKANSYKKMKFGNPLWAPLRKMKRLKTAQAGLSSPPVIFLGLWNSLLEMIWPIAIKPVLKFWTYRWCLCLDGELNVGQKS
jgi:hypothetical protein